MRSESVEMPKAFGEEMWKNDAAAKLLLMAYLDACGAAVNIALKGFKDLQEGRGVDPLAANDESTQFVCSMVYGLSTNLLNLFTTCLGGPKCVPEMALNQMGMQFAQHFWKVASELVNVARSDAEHQAAARPSNN